MYHFLNNVNVQLSLELSLHHHMQCGHPYLQQIICFGRCNENCPKIASIHGILISCCNILTLKQLDSFLDRLYISDLMLLL